MCCHCVGGCYFLGGRWYGLHQCRLLVVEDACPIAWGIYHVGFLSMRMVFYAMGSINVCSLSLRMACPMVCGSIDLLPVTDLEKVKTAFKGVESSLEESSDGAPPSVSIHARPAIFESRASIPAELDEEMKYPWVLG